MEIASSGHRKKHSVSDRSVRHPRFKAILVQLSSLVLSVLLLLFFKAVFGYLFHPFFLLFFHSSLSVLISLLLRFEWWWCLIQFIFPICVAAGLYLQIPPVFSLLTFLFLFFVFGGTFSTRVPYFPSHSSLPEQILKICPDKDNLSILDAGSGMGGMLMDLSKARPEWSLLGVEISFFPWAFSVLKSKVLHYKNLKFQFGSYEYLNFEKYDVVFVYLSPVVMSEIWKKVQYEMVPGSIFMSYEFPVNGVPPSFEIQLNKTGSILYVWQI